MVAFVIAPIGCIPIFCSVAGSILKVQPLVGWTDKFVFVRVITKVLGSELVFANELCFAIVVRILIKRVVLDEVPQTVLLQK